MKTQSDLESVLDIAAAKQQSLQLSLNSIISRHSKQAQHHHVSHASTVRELHRKIEFQVSIVEDLQQQIAAAKLVHSAQAQLQAVASESALLLLQEQREVVELEQTAALQALVSACLEERQTVEQEREVERVAHGSQLQQQVTEYEDVITLWVQSHGALQQEWDGCEEELARVGLQLEGVILERDRLVEALLTTEQGQVRDCALSWKP